jgi:D-serine deaminase-like pyridoxal phosphate-dependent protein
MTEQAYFEALAAALRQEALNQPTLIIDLDRLDDNIAAVGKAMETALGGSQNLRLVDKSLASIPLLAHIMEKTGTAKIMSFHLPLTLAVLEAFPEVDILYGKPLPVQALARKLNILDSIAADRLAAQTVFLIDTDRRLAQFSSLAEETGRTLRIAFEVDTGMHRGGFSSPTALRSALQQAAQSSRLRLEGIMGYEAHISEIPRIFGGPDGEMRKVKQRMAEFRDVLPPEAREIINMGGSKTALGYDTSGVATEISMGSGFIKPTDFETPMLDQLKPALFIATPILKVVDAYLPGPKFVTRLMQTIGLFPKKACFLYGGKWMAKPVYPEGMSANSIWGLSSNQQLMALASDCTLGVDDLVFFRPTQSEAVLQHFGQIALYQQGKITGQWASLPSSS